MLRAACTYAVPAALQSCLARNVCWRSSSLAICQTWLHGKPTVDWLAPRNAAAHSTNSTTLTPSCGELDAPASQTAYPNPATQSNILPQIKPNQLRLLYTEQKKLTCRPRAPLPPFAHIAPRHCSCPHAARLLSQWEGRTIPEGSLPSAPPCSQN